MAGRDDEGGVESWPGINKLWQAPLPNCKNYWSTQGRVREPLILGVPLGLQLQPHGADHLLLHPFIGGHHSVLDQQLAAQ